MSNESKDTERMNWLEKTVRERCIGTSPRRAGHGLITKDAVHFHLNGIGFVRDEEGSPDFPTLRDAIDRARTLEGQDART